MAPPMDSEVPTSNLWVGNLAGETVDSDLMELFGKHGELDSVKIYSARRFAFLYFKRSEDAKAAKDALQGANLHGNQLKIEFARPVKPNSNLWVGGISPNVSKEELEEEFCKFGKIKDFTFYRDRSTAYVEYLRLDDATEAVKSMNGKRVGGEQIRVDFLRSQSFRREQGPFSYDQKDGPVPHPMSKRPHSQLGAQKGDQPSNTLWVGYPPTLQIDEQMLHNAMILFGEIEKIKIFPSRHYSFIEFRSVEEARRAKEGLQGRLFNDPRITIMFSHSEIGPTKDYNGFHSGMKGPRPDAFSNENQFRASQVDMFMPSSGVLGPNQHRPLGAQGGYDPSGPEYNELAARRGLQDVDSKNWRPSPSIPSPTHGLRPQTRQSSSSWDVFDGNQFERESKRSRFEAAEDQQGLDQLYGFGPVINGGASGPFASVQNNTRSSRVTGKVVAGSPRLGNPDNDYIWRGLIAKGGTPVCHARCVPIGKGIGTELPNIVNCSARTGLDTLTKHYAEAIGFDIVYFLPDCEDDFASYTEFLHYLGSKNRAGVAKFDDGTTLFLVPPSDFLTKVLKVSGPERLYGVVLTLAPQVPSAAPVPKHPPLPAQSDYNHSYMKQEQASQVDYLPEHPKQLPPRSLGQPTIQSQTANGTIAVSQSGVSLTPELLATLASLLPATSQSSMSGGAQSSPLVSSTTQPAAQASEISNGHLTQGWSQDQPAGYSLQQSGNQYNPSAQAQPPSYHQYPYIPSTPSYSTPMVHGSAQFQESTVSLPQQGSLAARPVTNFNPSQTANFAVSAPVSQQYQPETPSYSQNGYGMMHGIGASAVYGSPVYQQTGNPSAASNQVNGATFAQPQNVMQSSVEKGSSEIPNQVQNMQSVPSGAVQSTSEEAEKNQRYQSTLQFASNLLLQIQQQQQQKQQEQQQQ